METIVVRKKNGSLVEVSADGVLSFCLFSKDGEKTVAIWKYPGGLNVATIEGVEAWRKGCVAPVDEAGFTGYYAKGNRVYAVFDYYGKYILPDGRTIFRLRGFDGDTPYPNTFRSHEEWARLGYVPVRKV